MYIEKNDHIIKMCLFGKNIFGIQRVFPDSQFGSFYPQNLVLGPVVQSVVSLTSSLRVISLTVFLFLLKNIDYGYLLEPSHRGSSNKYPQSMF